MCLCLTGQPKGVVRGNGGHAVALSWTMQHMYGVHPGEVRLAGDLSVPLL